MTHYCHSCGRWSKLVYHNAWCQSCLNRFYSRTRRP